MDPPAAVEAMLDAPADWQVAAELDEFEDL
jgi:hypothetical protein